jgi:glycosyltransferase involved in cell wall biosynthesis
VSNLPLVSIIMPTFNRADLIGESLDSVLSQSYLNWECIIVDDGSTDTTESVVEAYLKKDKRFRYFYKENGGAAVARNFAIKNSSGIYILPLDSDDLIHSTYIEKGINIFQKNPQLKIVYGLAEKFGIETGKWPIPNFNYRLFLIYNMIFNSSIYKRTDFERVGGYTPKNKFEDWDLWLKIIEKDVDIFQIQEVMYYYRTHINNSVTVKLERNQAMLEVSMNQLFKNHIDAYLQFIGNPILQEREARGLRKKVQSADFKAAEKLIRNPVFQFFRKVRNYLKRLFNGR